MTIPSGPSLPPVAVVGVGAHTPGSFDAPGFWRMVLAGDDMIRDVPSTHWRIEDHYDPDPTAADHTYCRRGAFLDPVDFDAVAHGIPPATLPATDTTQLLALRVAEQVLTDCGLLNGRGDREGVSVILGTAALEMLHTMSNRMQRPVWLKALRANGVEEPLAQRVCDDIAGSYADWQEATFPGLLSNVVSGRIANRFDLHGVNYTTDAACASSLAAVAGAINELALGKADLVLTGGVDTLNDIVMYMCFSKTPALSKSGDCRPFSDAADGTMLGEALVMLALKRLADAERDGDDIYAVIRGIGTSSDGRGSAIYAPVAAGQERALRRAYSSAGYGPETVELVEAHGTATAAGDVAEFSALRAVFEGTRSDTQWCSLGSVKSQIGHTKSAAGAAGLLKAVFALQHKTLPPTIKVDRPNPALDLERSPFSLDTRPRPWVRSGEHPRRASVSSFGFGGTNFHLTAEEYKPAAGSAAAVAPQVEAAPTQLVLLSANSAAEVLAQAEQITADRSLSSAARLSQESFDPSGTARLCLVAANSEELRAQVASLQNGTTVSTPTGAFLDTNPAKPGKVALLFSGQGSQYVGMGADLAIHVPAAMAAWDRAASLLADPVHPVVFPPHAFTEEESERQQELLTRTEWAQPALAVQGIAQLSVLRMLGFQADCAAGHSFGELVALHAAGVLDEPTLLRLARKRGELMAEAATVPGAMLAAEISPTDADRVLDGFDGQVWQANINSPAQVVFSGEVQAIARLADVLGERGTPVRRLRASAAFHTPLLSAARERFSAELDQSTFRRPEYEVYGNANAAPYPEGADAIRRTLSDHLLAPVRFADEIEAMYDAGVRTFVELGAGSVLNRFVADTLGDRPHTVVSLERKGAHGVTTLQRALGRLSVAGVPLDYKSWWKPYRAPDSTSAAGNSAATVRISGTNIGKPAGPDVKPVTPVATARPPSGPESEAWLKAFEETQQAASEAHAEYQRLANEAHLAYLKASEQSLRGLLEGNQIPAEMPVAQEPSPVAIPETPVVIPEPEAVAVETSDVGDILREILAEKTGYPLEVLEPHLELEGDLGIDSIKRVEVLSLLRKRIPGIATIEPAELTRLKTLGEVLARYDAASDDITTPPQETVLPSRLTRAGTVVRRVSAPGLELPGLRRGVVTVVDGGSDLAEAVVSLLHERGIDAESAGEARPETSALILLHGLRPVASTDDAIAVNREVFSRVRRTPAEFAERRGSLVVVQDTGGDFGLAGAGTRAWLGGLAGLARTMAKEWPVGVSKAVDCARGHRTPDQLAAALVAELMTGGVTTDIGLRENGTRWVLSDELLPERNSGKPALRPGSLVIATGGGRGVTAKALIALAQAHRPTLVVLGRSELVDEPPELAGIDTERDLRRTIAALPGGTRLEPSEIRLRAESVLAIREIRATLAALREAGATAEYRQVDVRDGVAVRGALEAARADFGPVAGLVHGAGVLADARLVDKTDRQFSAVFDTKVAGLQALLSATESDPLEFVCLFSSVAGRFGNVGQSDYAMANEVLAQVASEIAVRRPSCVVRSIAWGPWDGGMVGPELREHFIAGGVGLISPEAGAAAFVAECVTGPTPARVTITSGDLDSFAVHGGLKPVGAVHVHQDSHPHLADHAIDGVPVVPLAMALEWFRRVVPVTERVVLRDVKAVRRTLLPELAGKGHQLEMLGTWEEGKGLRLTLVDAKGRTCFEAVAAVEDEPVGPERVWTAFIPPAIPPAGPCYDGDVLFHGPAFRLLGEPIRISQSGAVAGVREMAGWPEEDWHTDPAAVDAGLQLALLWAAEACDSVSLPVRIGQVRLHHPGPTGPGTRCVLSEVDRDPLRQRCDVALLDEAGTVMIELLDVSLIRRPDKP
ncbi:SDR family NAD(P)-dependent oxidoreductase [Amycolatopsis japonica]|uniref:SDR family NAD(P)-dependent oxidoreductase n=1 Tax=Amycolatopsis japonica TaxID=208439 RepID=UPI00366A9AF3